MAISEAYISRTLTALLYELILEDIKDSTKSKREERVFDTVNKIMELIKDCENSIDSEERGSSSDDCVF
jgi:hypothetical protein